MSTSSNPSRSTPPPGDLAGWRALAEETRALVGDRDPLEILAGQDAALRAELGAISVRDLRTPESEGRWSAAHIVPHLVDTELAWAFRIRQIVVENEPLVQGFDQGRWADAFGYADEDVEESLRLLALLRQRNLRFFRALSGAEWERRGVHADRGPESLRDIARLMAGHDLRHLQQLRRIAARFASTNDATNTSREAIEIRPARPGDRAQVLTLLPRLESFGLPDNVAAGSVAAGEAREMAAAFDALPEGASLSVAVDPSGAVLGVLFLERRRDYFTGAPHGHVGVLAIAQSAEGRGLGRTLLAHADAWGRAEGYDRLTLTVFDGNVRARRLYERAGYRADLVRYRRDLGPDS